MSKEPKEARREPKVNESKLTSAGIPWSEVSAFALPYAEWLDGRHGSADDALPSLDQVPIPAALFTLPILHENRPRGSKAMADSHGAKQRLVNCRPGAWLLSPYTDWQWAKWPNGKCGWLPADVSLPESLRVRARNDTPTTGPAAPRDSSNDSAKQTEALTLRPGEPPIANILPVKQAWLFSAVEYLVQADEYRKGHAASKNAHCTFEIGFAYVQFRAPVYASYLICEAVSGELVRDIAAILTPKKVDQLIREFGFSAPARSPNFSQRIEIESRADLAFAARLAYRIFCDIYDVKDFAVAKFKAWPAKAAAVG